MDEEQIHTEIRAALGDDPDTRPTHASRPMMPAHIPFALNAAAALSSQREGIVAQIKALDADIASDYELIDAAQERIDARVLLKIEAQATADALLATVAALNTASNQPADRRAAVTQAKRPRRAKKEAPHAH